MSYKVGVIIPYKEDRGWLKYAIASIDRQDYEGDIHIIECKSKNLVGVNLNQGIEKALELGCDIIRYLCDDDTLTINSISETVRYFEENPQFDFLHSKAYNRWEATRREEIWIPPVSYPTLQQMITVNRLHGGTVAYRAECFKNNRFNEKLWTGEEYEFNMRLLSQGYKIGYLPSVTYIYRRHHKQKSLGNTDPVYQAQRACQIEMIKDIYR